jgi:HSP20 family molecular chaperone IbpA
MHSIIQQTTISRMPAKEPTQAFRRPHYDCQDRPGCLKLVIYVPGVEAAGVEITTCGPDLTVTAHKTHLVRVNWQALHLESAQRDYQLRLRLGSGVDFAGMHAALRDGLLTLEVPKKRPASASRPSLLDRLTPPRQRRVA